MWIFVLKASSFHFKPFLYLELVFSECIKMHFLLFIFQLPWVSVAAHTLSPVAVSGGYSSCGARASHCSGFFSCSREGSGTPLQCSCLETPMDGGAW